MIYENSIFLSGARKDYKKNTIQMPDLNYLKSENIMSTQQKKKLDL
jgi:hypothetical protein